MKGPQPVGNAREVGGDEAVFGEPRKRIGAGASGQLFGEPGGGAFERFVARAAADVAVDACHRLLDRGGAGAREAVARERDGEAYRAEAALGAAAVGDGPLGAVEVRGPGAEVETFNRDEVLARHVGQGQQARGHCSVAHGRAVRGQLAQQHGAGAAIAFAAAGFGAAQVLVLAHEVERRQGGRLVGLDEAVVEQ